MAITKKPLKKISIWFRSREDGSPLKYKTERHRDGIMTCFCMGDVYGVQKGIRCWHVKRLQEVAAKIDSGGKYKLEPLEVSDYKEE